ncbi:hypothetical protein OUZ56_030776 [Daphnia magna]|uniref:Uncharacterized protein n=1 Tax=Daphnia magna TaxID=35525 RepID=A0ABQ9ZS96_9CRUS|nr:hypothetical protein OUZ56_030776 [Daphnia magna]
MEVGNPFARLRRASRERVIRPRNNTPINPEASFVSRILCCDPSGSFPLTADGALFIEREFAYGIRKSHRISFETLEYDSITGSTD